jgi:hypothetical protein
MNTSLNPEHIITQLKRIVESDKRSEIRLNANGGNSILLLCPPELEFEYINELMEMMPLDTYKIFDLNELLLLFIKENEDNINELFDILRASVGQIFTAPYGEIRDDLYSRIIAEIQDSYNQDKIPVLINSGALYGSKLNFNKLLEDSVIENGKHPVIILYPGRKENKTYYFLNDKVASDYRCLIIE